MARVMAARDLLSREVRCGLQPSRWHYYDFPTRATGARHRVGFRGSIRNTYNHLAPSPLLLWGQQKTHSVEQQLALLGWTGIPVTDRPRTQLGVSPEAAEAINQRLAAVGLQIEDRSLFIRRRRLQRSNGPLRTSRVSWSMWLSAVSLRWRLQRLMNKRYWTIWLPSHLCTSRRLICRCRK